MLVSALILAISEFPRLSRNFGFPALLSGDDLSGSLLDQFSFPVLGEFDRGTSEQLSSLGYFLSPSFLTGSLNEVGAPPQPVRPMRKHPATVIHGLLI